MARVDMGGTVEISGFGKLSMATDATAPLLVVFGGITVGGVQSGVYMWNYMKGIRIVSTSSSRSTVTWTATSPMTR